MTMPQQQTDTAFLQVMVDAESKEMKETSWRVPLPFKLKWAHGSSTAVELCNDILDYFETLYNNQKFYFCSDTYPPTKDGLMSLKDALIVAAEINPIAALLRCCRGDQSDALS